ncbi:hypothetical protein ACLOJK_020402 [Asimina triloba]
MSSNWVSPSDWVAHRMGMVDGDAPAGSWAPVGFACLGVMELADGACSLGVHLLSSVLRAGGDGGRRRCCVMSGCRCWKQRSLAVEARLDGVGRWLEWVFGGWLSTGEEDGSGR